MTFHIPKLSKKQLAVLEKNRDAHDAMQKRINDTSETATSTSVEGAKNITVTYAQQNATKGYASGSKLTLVPAHIVTKQDGRMAEVIFSPNDYEAWSDGRYCAWCWTLQREAENPDWAVTVSEQPCDPVQGPPCTFPRGRVARERVLPYKVSSIAHKR